VQAGDGIRDFHVTGVQTCALPIYEDLETELLQGEGKAYGVEFLVKKNSGRFNGYLGYSYSRSLVKLDSQLMQERVNNGEFFSARSDERRVGKGGRARR